jgi:hypothetical protein
MMRRSLAALFVAACVYSQGASSAEQCYLRITNQMPVAITVTLQGRDLMHSKKRATGIAAGTYTVRDQGEIYQNAICDKGDRTAAASPIAPDQATPESGSM